MEFEMQRFTDSDTTLKPAVYSTTIEGSAGALEISGRSGPFTPLDKWKLEQAFSQIGATSSGSPSGLENYVICGDVEGSIIDSDGTKLMTLTIPDYEDLRLKAARVEIVQGNLEELSDTFQELQSELNESFQGLQSEMVNINNRLQDLSEAIDTASESEEIITELSTSVNHLNMKIDELNADMEDLALEQRNYLRTAGYSTDGTAVVFKDGFGSESFVYGSASYTVKTGSGEDTSDGEETPSGGNPDD